MFSSLSDVERFDPAVQAWSAQAMTKLRADATRTSDTHLHKLELPVAWGIDVYLKDESTHPTGSLKHRLARSLFIHALANGWLTPGAPVIEASSGSTAVSEAYFARMLGLPFIAVIPEGTSPAKITLIEREHGRCHFVADAAQVCAESERLAAATGGHFMNQFRYAERATDWRGINNIAQSIMDQMADEDHPVPAWIVVSAGTGGTAATIGRFIRFHQLDTRLCVVDPEGSAFFAGWSTNDPGVTSRGTRIEGIGRPRMEESFIRGVVDRMIRVPDAASIAATRLLSNRLGRRVGGSTGTNLVGVAKIITELRERDRPGSVVSLICDPGERYADTYFSDAWLRDQGIDIDPWMRLLESSLPAH